jgi:SAM-dependent methyltransferase
LAVVEPKPQGWSERYGAVFSEQDVVDHYPLRPPYPAETIDVLVELAAGAVVDLGCGPGEIARRLAPRVGRIDAIDVSAAMVDLGRALPGGDAPNVRWHVGRVEEAGLDGPYALAVAGDSVHWFDWETVFPRLVELLPGGVLALVHRAWLRNELLWAALVPVYERHSWNEDFEQLDLFAELGRRSLFEESGRSESAPEPWRPTLDELVGAHFSMSGFARSRLEDADAFAADVRSAVEETLVPRGGRYDLDVVGTVTWGRPRAGPAASGN